MVDEKPAPNHKDVWMDENRRCAKACSGGIGIGIGIREKGNLEVRRRRNQD